MKKVLIVKTSSMGDIIHTLPAVTDASRAYPDISFDWVVEEGFAEIPAWHSAVDKIIPVALRRWRKKPFSRQVRQEWRAYKQQLQATNYDAVIDAQGLLKSALFATRLARGNHFGLDKNSAREPLSALFYDQSFSIAKPQHAVERVRQLFAHALDYDLPQSQGEFNIRDQFITQSDETPYLVFNHSTTRFEKHWPELYWQQLIDLTTEAGWQIKLPWGNAQEQARAERLAQKQTNVTVLPKLSLSEIAVVIANAKACVSVDTGLSHLAAALDRPNIILFGPTDPGLVGGYGKDQICLQASSYEQTKGMPKVEPEVFLPLTPKIVWQELKLLTV